VNQVPTREISNGITAMACPYCGDLPGIELVKIGPGAAVRCRMCGVRGPVKSDARTAAVGWDHVCRVTAMADPRPVVPRSPPDPAPGANPERSSTLEPAGAARIGKDEAAL
jgi:hypothetical protein